MTLDDQRQIALSGSAVDLPICPFPKEDICHHPSGTGCRAHNQRMAELIELMNAARVSIDGLAPVRLSSKNFASALRTVKLAMAETVWRHPTRRCLAGSMPTSQALLDKRGTVCLEKMLVRLLDLRARHGGNVSAVREELALQRGAM